MLNLVLLLLFAAFLLANGAVISPVRVSQSVSSQSTCGCTATVTKLAPQELKPRQNCPSPTTITVTYVPPIVTIVSEDAASIASSFAYASQIDSFVHHASSQDRPISEPPETTPIFYTHTAIGPAVIGTDDPTDGTLLYHNAGTTEAPVATTIVSFPPEVTSSASVVTQTIYTIVYASTVTINDFSPASEGASNAGITSQGVNKRQIEVCSMIFASINGQWVSWCNEWNGFTTVKHSHYDVTTLITHPPGADPIPESVYMSSSTSSVPVTVQTSPPEPLPPMTSVSPMPPSSASSPSSSPTPSILSSSQAIVMTTNVVVTVVYPITTMTQTRGATTSSSTAVQAASPSCGQIGPFNITFDDLPAFSTSQPDNETTFPPIFNPYSHFYWSPGFGYAPPPKEPWTPNDGARLAEYNPKDEITPVSVNATGRELPGSFGAGPRAYNSIFWFDAQSLFVGCDMTGSESPCNLVATGYRWVVSTAPNATRFEGHEELAFSQTFTFIDACHTDPCTLNKITFDIEQFTGLSTLNLQADLEGRPTNFYFDTFAAAWTNNTCEAGLERSISRK